MSDPTRAQQAQILEDLASAPAFFSDRNDDDAWRKAARDGAAALRAPSPVKEPQTERRACACVEPDPVMQADRKFYCYTCSFETGARPRGLREAPQREDEYGAGLRTMFGSGTGSVSEASGSAGRSASAEKNPSNCSGEAPHAD